MTLAVRATAPEPIAAPASRYAAFRAAGRHTARVRFLRRAFLFGTVGGSLALVAFVVFDPFRNAIPGVSIESLGLAGTKVTMEQPKLTGFRTDGRPYTVVAKTAVQDVKTPNILELHEIDAHVTMADKSVAHVVSSLGIYDSSKETMTLSHDVHLTSDSGYDVRMTSAFVEFKTGNVDTREPLTVVMNTQTVTADTMHMVSNGKQVSFEGHVHSVMMPASTAASTAASLKGSGP